MKLSNEEIQKIEQLLRDSSYAKYHKLIQMTIIYLSWLMLYGINQVP